MANHIRALHPDPERPNYNDDIPNENLPGCGDTVLIDADRLPPAKEGDVIRDACPSCKKHDARLEIVEILSEE